MASVPVFGGSAEPGYERVRQVFEQHFRDGIEDCAQCCVFVKGKQVVDLWGARKKAETGAPAHDYGPDSIQNVFSSSKVLTSLVVAMLADRGHLSYQQLITDIWPEYAQHGKAATTVAQLMRHEAGLPEFDQPLDLLDLTAKRVREGAVSDIIAGQKPKHVPGERRVYHGLTRGWIINEVVRRADPSGRTVGQFLHDEVAVPLGLETELVIGVPDESHSAVVPLKTRSLSWTMSQLLRPRALGGGKIAGLNSISLRALFLVLLPAMRVMQKVSKQKGPLVINGERYADPLMLFNTPEARRSEMPSANGHCSARALAKVAATIVQGGALEDGARLLSPEGTASALGDPVMKWMFTIMRTRFTNAGWNLWGASRLGYVGWMGLGGSVMQWHPEEQIGFGYAMNLIETAPWNARGLNLQQAALDCAKRLNPSPAPLRSSL